ncbi:MAG TPA: hypothetical protein VLA24_06150, partial [Pseudomonadales bacterium]|nr:hypothetical protein [Pseudomonadales bacterium]
MQAFTPLRLILKMRSPVVLTAVSPTLDGILFEALKQRAPGKSNLDILSALKEVLAFNASLGVFHASSMRFGVNANTGLVALDYYRTDYLHEGKRSSSMFSPNGKNRYKKLVVTGGPTKRRLTHRHAYA